MSSSRPASIRIIGKTFEVEWQERIEHEGECVNGLFDSDTQQIQVVGNLPLELSQDALLHEVMHAVEFSMGLDLEESVVNRMATGLLAVIKDNPRFVSYLRRKK